MIATLRIEPRWTDLDPVGHVSNSVFLVYAEEARNRFLFADLRSAWDVIVVVRTEVDHTRPIEPSDGAVVVVSRVETFGRSSMTTTNTISTEAGELCATVRTVQVKVLEDRSASAPWTDDERTTLQRLQEDPAGHE